MVEFIPLIISTAISSVVGAVIASCIAIAKTHASSVIKENKAFQQGMRALLWRELNEIYMKAKDENGMSVSERKHLENVYVSYHGLGGNGTGTRLFDEAMKLPVLQN